VATDVSEELIASIFRVEKHVYINPDFRLADYSACHLLSRWFLAQLIFSTLKMEAIYSLETSVEIRVCIGQGWQTFSD
jgi:hypothetical protein